MGRITIFSLNQCPHCIRVKAIFNSLNWEYYNISLDEYPEKKDDMLKISDRLTVPQVFFGEQHLGGASDILNLEKDGKLLHMYKKLVLGQSIPTTPELQKPSNKEKQNKKHVESLTESPICFGGVCQTYSSLIQSLVGPARSKAEDSGGEIYLDIADRRLQYFELQRNCFPGSNLVDVLLSKYNFPSGREEACEVAIMLMDMGAFFHITSQNHFEDSPQVFYRLKQHSEPLVLNSYRVWNDRVGTDPNLTLAYCRGILMDLVQKYTNKETGKIHYNDIRIDSGFIQFEIAVCELQKVMLSSMNENDRKCFVINLYNLMVYHAYIKVGIPRTTYQRLSFFSSVSYNLGGEVYSFNDLEHGVLRCNARPLLSFRVPFSSGDSRLKSMLATLDNRIHFALNCGGASCPAIKEYSKENLDAELNLASMGFLESTDNIKIDLNEKSIYFNRIFSWYFSDFGKNKEAFLQQIVRHLRKKKKKTY